MVIGRVIKMKGRHNKMKKTLFILAATCLIACYASDTYAQIGKAQGDPCSGDQQKYCAGVEQGPQMGDCLDKNLSRLSKKCRAAHENITKNITRGLMPGHPLSGCREDIQKLCSNVDAGMGPIMECPMRYESLLSEGCKIRLRDIPPPGTNS